MEPTIRYAMNGDVAIAYETLGEGPVDLVALAPINNLEIVGRTRSSRGTCVVSPTSPA